MLWVVFKATQQWHDPPEGLLGSRLFAPAPKGPIFASSCRNEFRRIADSYPIDVLFVLHSRLRSDFQRAVTACTAAYKAAQPGVPCRGRLHQGDELTAGMQPLLWRLRARLLTTAQVSPVRHSFLPCCSMQRHVTTLPGWLHNAYAVMVLHGIHEMHRLNVIAGAHV